MPNFFVAYEGVSDIGSMPALEAAIASLGEVVCIHDALLLLNTSSDAMEVLSHLIAAAGDKARFVIIPADARASLMNARPGVIESFKRIVEI